VFREGRAGSRRIAPLIMAAGVLGSGQLYAQTAAPAPSPSKQAIEARKAAFVLIGQNFKPIGDALQGRAPYDAQALKKRADRVAFLADLLPETFPDVSNVGEPGTRTKPEAWSDRADFEQKLKDFRTRSATLAQVVARESTASEAF